MLLTGCTCLSVQYSNLVSQGIQEMKVTAGIVEYAHAVLIGKNYKFVLSGTHFNWPWYVYAD